VAVLTGILISRQLHIYGSGRDLPNEVLSTCKYFGIHDYNFENTPAMER